MQRLFDKFNFVKIFLDDLLSHSDSLSTHKEHLEKILKIFNRNKIKINFEKSNFMTEEVTYLGNIINSEGIRADTTRLKRFTLDNFKPKSIKDIQRIVGILNWYRPYVQNLSAKITSITDKLKRNKWKNWKETDTNIIKEIFDEIYKNLMLTHLDPSEEFFLFVDASNLGISGVLTQKRGIVGIYSKKLTGSELNYSIVEKECYAIIKSILFFKVIIYNAKITIFTDSKNITFNKNFISSRWQRWKIILEEFDYEMKHLPGIQNIGADYFSRNFMIKSIPETDNILLNSLCIINVPNEQEITKNQLYEHSYIMNKKSFKYYLDNDKKFYLFKEPLKQILQIIHEYLVHPGISKSYNSIKNEMTRKNLKTHVANIVNNCIKYQLNKSFKNNTGSLNNFLISKSPQKK